MILSLFLIVGKEFQGRRLKVSMARRKPMMGGMRGGMPMRDGMMGRGGKCQQCLLVFKGTFTLHCQVLMLFGNPSPFLQHWSP